MSVRGRRNRASSKKAKDQDEPLLTDSSFSASKNKRPWRPMKRGIDEQYFPAIHIREGILLNWTGSALIFVQWMAHGRSSPAHQPTQDVYEACWPVRLNGPRVRSFKSTESDISA